jgi:ABC-type taurine transport system substrate-binding protein
LAPNLLRIGVEAVVGAAWPVIDDAAVEIAESFYDIIGQGVEVGTALNRARRTIEARDDIPYWLGYALFGDPDLRLRDDDGWKVDAIRSGGRVAAASTFSGRASLHVSSLHSFLMSAAMTDTSALAIACECKNSEALVQRLETDLLGIAAEREVRIGVPGATGSSVFARKIALEIGLARDRCRFIELDTAEVRLALDRGVIDATVLWYPDLSGLDPERYSIRFSEGVHDYTLCVLVGRTPRTDEERRAARQAVTAFADLSARLTAAPRRWSKLLAEQMGLQGDQIMGAMAAYDFQLAGHTSHTELPSHVRDFIDCEVEYMQAAGLAEPGLNLSEILLAQDNLGLDATSAGEPLAADIQWSISSLPLLMGRFLGVYS